MTPADFTAHLIAVATDFVGLAETKENAAWDDPHTHAVEDQKSNVLRSYMALCGWESGEPYCAAFCGAMIACTAKRCGLNADRFLDRWSPHCVTAANTFKAQGWLDYEPSDGSIMLMRHGVSSNGHAAIVAHVTGAYPNRMLATIEGNTMPGSQGDQRQGDGIYLRARNVRKNGDLNTLGFVSAKTLLSLLGTA